LPHARAAALTSRSGTDRANRNVGLRLRNAAVVMIAIDELAACC
jgi:hypothetical protein